MPHMHLRGKDWRYEATYPDGKHEVLLSVPKYDFGWQTNYRFVEPKLMPQGTVMSCVAHFDNSPENLNNPDPTKEVTFGDQTFEEMMIGFFELAPASQDLLRDKQPEKLTRAEQFGVIMRATKGEPDDNLKAATHMALAGGEWLMRFGQIVSLMAPQVDRVCVSTVEDDQLTQFHGLQPPQGRKDDDDNETDKAAEQKAKKKRPETFHSPLPNMPASGEPLADVIASNEAVVHNDLSQQKGTLFDTMKRRGAKSSLHVPVTVAGKKMAINFWSRDAAAFPPAAVEFLTSIAKAMAEPYAEAKTAAK